MSAAITGANTNILVCEAGTVDRAIDIGLRPRTTSICVGDA